MFAYDILVNTYVYGLLIFLKKNRPVNNYKYTDVALSVV